jgi:hypothetical protein
MGAEEVFFSIIEKQDEYLDIVFAFGSFGETAEEIFEKEKQLISSFIDSVQKRDTHYGVVEIGPRAKICAKIGQYRDHVRLKRHVNLIRRSGDATALDHALEVAANMFENQARANSKRVLVVFTNGKSGAQVTKSHILSRFIRHCFGYSINYTSIQFVKTTIVNVNGFFFVFPRPPS